MTKPKKTPDPDELSTEEAEHLIDQIVEFGRPYPILRITGRNALLREDIFQIIGYAKERRLTVTIAPSTTPHLNRKNIERLKEAGCQVRSPGWRRRVTGRSSGRTGTGLRRPSIQTSPQRRR
jgi:MoaA/NifB/PqqE/SkfB family radical SAM enzyme